MRYTRKYFTPDQRLVGSSHRDRSAGGEIWRVSPTRPTLHFEKTIWCLHPSRHIYCSVDRLVGPLMPSKFVVGPMAAIRVAPTNLPRAVSRKRSTSCRPHWGLLLVSSSYSFCCSSFG